MLVYMYVVFVVVCVVCLYHVTFFCFYVLAVLLLSDRSKTISYKVETGTRLTWDLKEGSLYLARVTDSSPQFFIFRSHVLLGGKCHFWTSLYVSIDPEAGVAQALAHLHQWHCGGKSYQREPLSEQHGHSQAAQRRGLWLLQWPDDPSQG